MSERIQVWDIPTRIFHWSLVLSFCGAFLTAESEHYRDIHSMLGYTVLGLVAFRLLWGVIGSRYARFSSFLFKPAEVVAYVTSLVQGKAKRYVGHNPAGSVAIWLLLLMAISSGLTGVFLLHTADGEELEELHELLSFAMLAVVIAHIAGIVYSGIMHRENLIRAMFTGSKEGDAGEEELRSHAWLGVIMLVAMVTFWAAYSAFSAMAPDEVRVHSEQHDDDD